MTFANVYGRRKKDMNQQSVLYTSNVLDTIYKLKSSDEVVLDNGQSYACGISLIDGFEFYTGLCTEDYKAHILTANERVIIDILLSWSMLTNEDFDSWTVIKYSDIDWIRSRCKKNKERSKPEKLSEDTTYRLLEFTDIYENDEAVGFKYSLCELESMLRNSKLMTSINGNIFKFSLNEDMKYQLLRYLIISSYMCRARKTECKRTHRSILKNLVITEDEVVLSYYDVIKNKKYFRQYLLRYNSRLIEVLEFLKEIGYIVDYSADRLTNLHQLETGSGMVRIKPKMYKKSKR